jgi:hypothetical protein
MTDYTVTFGPSFGRLTSAEAMAVGTRVKAALDPLMAPSATRVEIASRIGAMVQRGYGRLDDASLVELLRLRTAALAKVDVASCAAYGRLDRESFLNSEATIRMDEALDVDQYASNIEIEVDAIEAEATAEGPRGSLLPAGVGAVPGATMDALFRKVYSGLDPTDAKNVAAVITNADDTDVNVCAAWRAIYTGVLSLDSANLATYARGDVVAPGE